MTDDRMVAIQECKKILNSKKIFVDFFNNSYTVYECVRVNKKEKLKRSFEIQCKPNSVVSHVEYLLFNEAKYTGCAKADELLAMVETIFDQQQYNEIKKMNKKIAKTKQKIVPDTQSVHE